jgi:secondary thiamine-phosphate synthase enzyme
LAVEFNLQRSESLALDNRGFCYDGAMREQLQVNTSKHIQLLDITGQVKRMVQSSGLKSGACLIFCPHTTAGLTINENADPDVRTDLERAFPEMVPSVRFDHGEGNSPAHFLSSVVGAFLYLPVHDAQLQLGTWQGIFFCEFDGPRQRKVWVQVL